MPLGWNWKLVSSAASPAYQPLKMTLHFNQVECPSKSFAAKLNYSLLATSDFSKCQFHKRNRTWAKFFGRCSSSFDEWCWIEQCGHCSHYTLCIILRVGEWVLKVVGVFTLHQTVCNSKVISHLFRICKKTEEYYIWCKGRRRGPNLSFFVGIFYLIIKGHNGMYSKWLNFSLFRPQVWHVPS